MKRPFVLIGASVFLSSAAALFFGEKLAFFAAVGLALLALIALFIPVKCKLSIVAALIFSSLSLASYIVVTAGTISPIVSFMGRTSPFEGVITETNYNGSNVNYIVAARLPLADGSSIKTEISLYTFSEYPITTGYQISGTAKFFPDEGRRLSYQRLGGGRILYGTLEGMPKILSASEQPGANGIIAGLRLAVIRANERLLPPKNASLLNAMLLGERERLTEETKLMFTRSGLVHLMAVSGFHVSLLSSMIISALCAAGLKKKYAAAISLPFLIVFMAMCGFSASVVRAGLMMGVYILSLLLNETYDPLSALGLSAAIICIINPYSALQTGFMLSFAATLGIILLSDRIFGAICGAMALKPWQVENGRLGFILLRLLAVSVGAYLFSLPIMAAVFNSVSIISPLASFFVMPVGTFMLWCDVVALICYFIPPLRAAARVISVITALFADITEALATGLGSLKFSAIPTDNRFIAFLFIAASALIVAAILLRLPKQAAKIVAGSLPIVAAFSVMAAGAAESGVTRFYTFSGGGSLVLISGGKAALIGFPESRSEGERIRGIMLDKNVSELSLCVNTKRTNGNVGILEVLDFFPPAELVIPRNGAFTRNILERTPSDSQVLEQSEAELYINGVKLSLDRCGCGLYAGVIVGETKLLKLNKNCDIISSNYGSDILVKSGEIEAKTPMGAKSRITDDRQGKFTLTVERHGGEAGL